MKAFLDGANPIGQAVRSSMLKIDRPDLLAAQAPDDWLEVIGVLADARNDGLDHPNKARGVPSVQLHLAAGRSVVGAFRRQSGRGPCQSVKKQLRQINADLVVGQDHTLVWWLETQGWGQGRFIATLFSLFAILALALAATGLYSVVSFAVTQRTQELGLMDGSGAPRSNILQLVIRSTAIMLAAGIVVELGLSIALNRVVGAWAGGSPRDPLILFSAALVLVLVSVIGVYRSSVASGVRRSGCGAEVRVRKK